LRMSFPALGSVYESRLSDNFDIMSFILPVARGG